MRRTAHHGLYGQEHILPHYRVVCPGNPWRFVNGQCDAMADISVEPIRETIPFPVDLFDLLQQLRRTNPWTEHSKYRVLRLEVGILEGDCFRWNPTLAKGADNV